MMGGWWQRGENLAENLLISFHNIIHEQWDV